MSLNSARKFSTQKGGVSVFQHAKPESLEDFFLPLSKRKDNCVYFCRIDGYSENISKFIRKYFDQARRNGVVIDGRIPNPDTNNLNYFTEMLGDEFKLDQNFLDGKLKKWLPRMSDEQRHSVVSCIYSTLQDMLRHGKNENMLRNAYVKYMCWLYYKFERIVNQLGAENPPKILYDGTVSNYELQLLIVLSRAGADILMLEKAGDAAYQQLDPQSEYSTLYVEAGTTRFPAEFNMKWIQAELQKEANRERLYGKLPQIKNCTNAWMKQPKISEALTGVRARGEDPNYFYNAFVIQFGVEDRLLFSNDLFSFYRELKNTNRPVCIVNGGIPVPTPEEIAGVKRRNYANVEQLVSDLSRNIQYTASNELERAMVKSFIDIILEESQAENENVSRLTNKAVYLLAWLKRYQGELFHSWKMPEVGVFVLFGKCETVNECLFLRMLAKLPVDVLVIIPNLNAGCRLSDPALLEIKYEESLPMEEFPTEQSQMRVTTAACQAERDLDTLMYQDSGLYRNQQYAKAETVTLQTMYEEISLLWDQELKYRPGFATVNDTVTIPVLLEKISGVKDGNVNQYWLDIKKLITPDTIVVPGMPWMESLEANPIKPYVTQFLQRGRLQKNKIKSHKAYPYGILRQEMQDYLLDKIQVMLDQKVVKGIYENGTEYTVLATILNLNKDIVRLIQKFDFTKKNPKIIIINPAEKVLNLEESIVVAFLNLIGFDILFFVPTGYQCVEGFFQNQYIHEHQIGEYVYDLTTPDFNTVQENSGFSSFRRLFGRSF